MIKIEHLSEGNLLYNLPKSHPSPPKYNVYNHFRNPSQTHTHTHTHTHIHTLTHTNTHPHPHTPTHNHTPILTHPHTHEHTMWPACQWTSSSGSSTTVHRCEWQTLLVVLAGFGFEEPVSKQPDGLGHLACRAVNVGVVQPVSNLVDLISLKCSDVKNIDRKKLILNDQRWKAFLIEDA